MKSFGCRYAIASPLAVDLLHIGNSQVIPEDLQKQSLQLTYHIDNQRV